MVPALGISRPHRSAARSRTLDATREAAGASYRVWSKLAALGEGAPSRLLREAVWCVEVPGSDAVGQLSHRMLLSCRHS